MAEYIEREAAIEAVKHAFAKGLEPSQYIEIIPAADVARCHECSKHSDADGKHYCKFWRMYCPDDSDFFCKAGKRKDGDGNA